MDLSFSFFLSSILLGIGLAMDAFSVSLANGLNEPCMRKKRVVGIAAIFACFQFAMPMIGWVCVTSIASLFGAFEKFIFERKAQRFDQMEFAVGRNCQTADGSGILGNFRSVKDNVEGSHRYSNFLILAAKRVSQL